MRLSSLGGDTGGSVIGGAVMVSLGISGIAGVCAGGSGPSKIFGSTGSCAAAPPSVLSADAPCSGTSLLGSRLGRGESILVNFPNMMKYLR